MAFVGIDECVDARRSGEGALDLGAQRRLIGFDGEQIIGVLELRPGEYVGRVEQIGSDKIAVLCSSRHWLPLLARILNADAIAQLERQVDRQRADLGHIDATIRLFDPSIEDEETRSTAPRAHNNWFRPGECRRRIYDVLREVTEAMTTRDVVAGVMKAKGLREDDARTRELVHKTVLCSLNRARDTIERSEAAGITMWRVI